MTERDAVIAALEAPLDPARVRTRDAGRGRQVPYLEGHDVISTANAIFGYDGWSYSVDRVDVSSTTVGRLFYRANVTVSALGVQRSDIGIAIVEQRRGSAEDAPEAHDMALKGAVTDALKRALRTFGAQFGNELYDKGHAERPAQSSADRRVTPEPRRVAGEGKNVGDLLSWALREHNLPRARVLEIVGVTDAREIGDLALATRAVQAFVANREEPASAE